MNTILGVILDYMSKSLVVRLICLQETVGKLSE